MVGYKCAPMSPSSPPLLLLRPFNSIAESLDVSTYTSALKACARFSALQQGRQIHSVALKIHTLSTNLYVQSSLVHLYAKCGRLNDALKVFDAMPERSVVTWNSMLDGYARAGEMPSAWVCFMEMPDRNVVSWNSMIAGCVQNSLPDEALKLFLGLRMSGLRPDEGTMSSVVAAISDLGLLLAGKIAHGYITRHGLSLNGALGVSLMNMYSKCGSMTGAQAIFAAISAKNVTHWTSVIAALAAHGHAEASLRMFSEILRSGVKPNDITFLGVLCACSYGGLLDEGLRYFNLMRNMGIEPRIQHYGCLVDLLGRSGLLEEAMQLIKMMPMEPSFVIWVTLLAACRNHGNIEIAEIATRKLVEIEPNHGSPYLLMSSIYARKGRWEDSAQMRRMMKKSRAENVHGYSWIEVDGCVHEFVAGDRDHVQSREIYGLLDEMSHNLRWAGYERAT